LYKAIRKYGIENFTFEVLEECNINELDIKEKYYIHLFDTTNSNIGYNLTQGGQDSHCVNSKISEEDLQKIVDLLKNSLLSETEIAK
jgi:group I intron endonuclease